MKNKIFVILLSVIVGISSVQTADVLAAARNYLYISKKPVSKKTIYVGEDGVKLKYNIGGRTKGIKGIWKSDNTSRVKVSKNGNCVAVGNGKATVSFTYKYGRKTYTLKCKVTAETKAEEVSILNSAGTTEDVAVEIGTDYKFKSKVKPVEEAVEINNKIKSTDKVFYQLFEDEDCTRKSKLGSIDSKGVFSAGSKSGTLYVRASAKKKKNAEDDIVSDVIKITIEDTKTEEKPKNEENKKDENISNTDKPKSARIELSTYAIIRDVAAKNGVYFADVYFKVFDEGGKEITAAPDVTASRFSASWKGDSVQINDMGKVTLIFPANIPNQPTPLGTTGELKLTYKNTDNSEISAVQTVRVVPPSIIASAEFKGIYRCVYRNTATESGIVYEPVIDGNVNKLKNGDVIKDFGSNAWVNMNPDSYYLLVKATDNYGNNISTMGLKDSALAVDVTGSAIVSLDTVFDNGAEMKESIRPIAIDGVSYLTYPLREGTVKSGEVNITIWGGAVRSSIKKMITDGSSLGIFYFTGGNAYIGEDNIIPYVIYTTSGGAIKDYNSVLYYLGLTDTYNQGMIILPPDSKVISSSKGSTFSIRKNALTGEAEIHYQPHPNVLMNASTMLDYGTDEVTVLKGYGMNLEKKLSIVVSRKRS